MQILLSVVGSGHDDFARVVGSGHASEPMCDLLLRGAILDNAVACSLVSSSLLCIHREDPIKHHAEHTKHDNHSEHTKHDERH